MNNMKINHNVNIAKNNMKINPNVNIAKKNMKINHKCLRAWIHNVFFFARHITVELLFISHASVQ